MRKKALDASPGQVEEPITDAKAHMIALVEAYKKASPEKYERRKAELQAKIDAIK